MKRKDLVAAAAAGAQVSRKEAEAVITAAFAAITEELKKGGKVQLSGFGTFEVRTRAARTGRNLQTGASVEIAASKVPAFKAGKSLKEAVQD